jgi:L-amino acid N-acyltransferase YncA
MPLSGQRYHASLMSEIRFVTSDDAAGIAAIYGPIVASSSISFEVEPPGEEEMRRRIQDTPPAYPWLVCEHRDRVAGYAYATRHRVRAAYQWSVDTSVYVHPDVHRCGIGRALYASLVRILAAQGYFNACAGIALPNAASVGLHESVGFEPVGVYRHVGYKFGAWHDVGWWQLGLQPSAAEPRPLLSLAEIRRHPSCQLMLVEGLSRIRFRQP